ncbi:MAG: OsmC family protein [Desulfobacterales bacterium]|nr:OsmC family protein [Desulfobacterales bacterium]
MCEAKGEVEKEGRVLVVKRIHVDYHLKLAPAHEAHAEFCPVARTLKGCVEITTRLEMEEI